MKKSAQKYSRSLLIALMIVLAINMSTAFLMQDFIHGGVSLMLFVILGMLHAQKRLTQIVLLLTPFMIMLYSGGSYLGLYHVRHYDKLVHIYSSFLVAYFISAYFRTYLLRLAQNKKWNAVLLIVSLGFCVGITWELFEYTMQNVLHKDLTNGPLDTIYDLIIDTIGTFVAATLVVFRSFLKPK